MFLLIRVLLGSLFIISGGEKVLSPAENFLFVIHGYNILPSPLEFIVALIFPWVELLTGLFILIGLWLRQSLFVLLIMSISLMAIVSQAIIRQLPLENCGCFGELLHLPLRGVLVVDIMVTLMTVLCLIFFHKTEVFSLDSFYVRSKKN